MNDSVSRADADGDNPGGDNALHTTALISNKRGLHARAAAKFVKVAGDYDARIWVTRDGQRVSGGSIMGLMMLAAAQGCSVDISAEGREAPAALAAIIDLINDKFGEDKEQRDGPPT